MGKYRASMTNPRTCLCSHFAAQSVRVGRSRSASAQTGMDAATPTVKTTAAAWPSLYEQAKEPRTATSSTKKKRAGDGVEGNYREVYGGMHRIHNASAPSFLERPQGSQQSPNCPGTPPPTSATSHPTSRGVKRKDAPLAPGPRSNGARQRQHASAAIRRR